VRLAHPRNIEKEPDTAIPPCPGQRSNINFHHFRPAANLAILVTRKWSAGEDQREPFLGVRDVGNDTIDSGVGPSDEGLLCQSDASIIKDPRSMMFVG
jgi:hypothetical protein